MNFIKESLNKFLIGIFLIIGTMFGFVLMVIDSFKPTREEKILDECGCVCYCPKCKDALNDQASCSVLGDGSYEYICSCSHRSVFNFDIAPVPILVEGDIKESKDIF